MTNKLSPKKTLAKKYSQIEIKKIRAELIHRIFQGKNVKKQNADRLKCRNAGNPHG